MQDIAPVHRSAEQCFVCRKRCSVWV